MRNSIFNVIFLLTVSITLAQVGIGTNNPQSELHIESNDNDIPSLQITPQIAPIGTVQGQIAMINDILYTYDSTRNKWLSVEITKLSFGLEDNVNNQSLEYSGDVERIGPILPKDATIVYITANSSGGNQSKQFQLAINGINVADNIDPTIDGLLQLTTGIYSTDQYNVDVNLNQTITITVPNTGTPVRDLIVEIWVKWRN